MQILPGTVRPKRHEFGSRRAGNTRAIQTPPMLVPLSGALYVPSVRFQLRAHVARSIFKGERVGLARLPVTGLLRFSVHLLAALQREGRRIVRHQMADGLIISTLLLQ